MQKGDRLDRFNLRLNNNKIPSLDGLRAIAVLLVIVSHFNTDWVNGGLGVMIFFVLSGFLITWLLLKESDKKGTVSLKNFYIRRALRIFPAYYLFCFAGILIYIYRGHELIFSEVMSALFYYSNYYYGIPIGEADSSLFGHTWSLAVEEQFYLLWPFVFVFAKQNTKRLFYISIAIIAIIWVYRALLVIGFDVRQEYLYRAFDTRFDHLMIGCFMAIGLKIAKLNRLIIILTKHSWYPLITLFMLFGNQFFHSSYMYTFTLAYMIEPILIVCFLIQCIYFTDVSIWKLLENPIVIFLGSISYPLYLWQQLTIHTAKTMSSDLPVLLQLLFAIFVTVIFASASYFLVEKQFLKLKHKWI
ncbi:MAG: peptidoglycan/LPS O-acetylase OafA/YrhL [bacterium]|jgi:peptidoglycan/LPS O-acetylase OafA/YrhL